MTRKFEMFWGWLEEFTETSAMSSYSSHVPLLVLYSLIITIFYLLYLLPLPQGQNAQECLLFLYIWLSQSTRMSELGETFILWTSSLFYRCSHKSRKTAICLKPHTEVVSVRAKTRTVIQPRIFFIPLKNHVVI
jgi:hypothetical protein